MFVTNESDLAVDISGYFGPPDYYQGLRLYTVSPCRAFDSRSSGSGAPFIDTLFVPVSGTCNIPSNAAAVVLNATVIPSAQLGYLTLWQYGVSQPLASNLNAEDVSITSNMAIVPTANGGVNAFASDMTHLILDVTGYFAP